MKPYAYVCILLYSLKLEKNLAIYNKSKRITGQKIITTNEMARVNVLKHLH